MPARQREGRLLRETARHLAVRMSYEDVIRVAQAKIAPDRIARIVANAGGKPGEPVAIVEFLKPGIEEICHILPPRLATRDPARLRERRGWIGRFHWGMEIKTTSVTGYLRFLMLAKLRRFRPRTYQLPAGAGRDRSLARADRGGCGEVGRARARNRRMRAADQGLWRHLEARRRELRRRSKRGSSVRCWPDGCRCRAGSTRSRAPAPRPCSTPRAKASRKCLADIERSPGLGIAAE